MAKALSQRLLVSPQTKSPGQGHIGTTQIEGQDRIDLMNQTPLDDEDWFLEPLSTVMLESINRLHSDGMYRCHGNLLYPAVAAKPIDPRQYD